MSFGPIVTMFDEPNCCLCHLKLRSSNLVGDRITVNPGETALDYRRSYLSLACGHEFHLACAKRLARFHANVPTVPCPMCRTPFPASEVTELRGPPPFNVHFFVTMASHGLLEHVNQQLALNGAEVDARLNGFTALQAAAMHGREAVVQRLIAAGANVNAVNAGDGLTALLLAASFGHGAIVDRLLAAGADVNAVLEDGISVLMSAAEEGYLAVVNRLLDAGALVNAVDNHGRTALLLTASHGHGAIVDRLLAAGADVNAADEDGDSALIVAAKQGHEAVVARLLRAGANVGAVDTEGRTALQLAVLNGHQAAANRIQAWLDAPARGTRARTRR